MQQALVCISSRETDETQSGEDLCRDTTGDCGEDYGEKRESVLKMEIKKLSVDGKSGFLVTTETETEATSDAQQVLSKVCAFVGIEVPKRDILPIREPEIELEIEEYWVVSEDEEIQLQPKRKETDVKEVPVEVKTEPLAEVVVPFMFKECPAFKWSGLPEQTIGKNHIRQNETSIRIERDGYKPTRIWADLSDLNKLRGMDKPALKQALSNVASVKQSLIRSYLKDTGTGNTPSKKTETEWFKEAHPFDTGMRPEKYGNMFMWDYNGRFATGKVGVKERLFLTKKDTERLLQLPKDQLEQQASGLSTGKKELLIEFIETLKDIRIGAFSKTGTSTRVLLDSGDGRGGSGDVE